MTQGLDLDGRIVTLDDLRILIRRYGYEVQGDIREIGLAHVRAEIYQSPAPGFRGMDRDHTLASLLTTIKVRKPIGVVIDISEVPRPSVSDGSAYR